ncbi:MAG TPA: hypothetical protein VK763_20700 [Terriglobales bacterium]|nr:hypothetical protein [Terriglobales bacterium]
MNTSASNSSDGKEHALKDELRSPLEYENRFDELLRKGYRWINLSCYGVHEGFLIIGVVVPGVASATHPGYHTSVNLSGPLPSVLDQQWRVGSILTIT